MAVLSPPADMDPLMPSLSGHIPVVNSELQASKPSRLGEHIDDEVGWKADQDRADLLKAEEEPAHSAGSCDDKISSERRHAGPGLSNQVPNKKSSAGTGLKHAAKQCEQNGHMTAQAKPARPTAKRRRTNPASQTANCTNVSPTPQLLAMHSVDEAGNGVAGPESGALRLEEAATHLEDNAATPLGGPTRADPVFGRDDRDPQQDNSEPAADAKFARQQPGEAEQQAASGAAIKIRNKPRKPLSDGKRKGKPAGLTTNGKEQSMRLKKSSRRLTL